MTMYSAVRIPSVSNCAMYIRFIIIIIIITIIIIKPVARPKHLSRGPEHSLQTVHLRFDGPDQ